MILFLYGSDTYRSKQKLSQIKDQFIQKHGIENLSSFEFAQEPVRQLHELRNYLREPSFFSKAQMAVSYDFLNTLSKLSKKHINETLTILKQIYQDKYFWLTIWEEFSMTAKTKNLPLVKYVSNHNNVGFNEFSSPSSNTLVTEGINYLKSKKTHINREILQKIAQDISESSLFFSNLDLLVSYMGNESNLTFDSLNILHLPVKHSQIFDLLDAVNGRNRPQMFLLMNKYHHLYQNNPLQLFGLIHSQIIKIYMVKDLTNRGLSMNDISKKLKMKPYPLKKIIQCLKHYSLKDLQGILLKMRDLDVKTKTGKISQLEMLDLLPLIF